VSRDVVLYTRKECGLCDEAAAMLCHLSRDLRFTVTAIDIDEDPQALADYNDVIPVIAVGGRIVSQAPVDEVALREALSAALG
jgi:thiol-disulfide isomerase/thioredoxin